MIGRPINDERASRAVETNVEMVRNGFAMRGGFSRRGFEGAVMADSLDGQVGLGGSI
jgi:hypothetical protein